MIAFPVDSWTSDRESWLQAHYTISHWILLLPREERCAAWGRAADWCAAGDRRDPRWRMLLLLVEASVVAADTAADTMERP